VTAQIRSNRVEPIASQRLSCQRRDRECRDV